MVRRSYIRRLVWCAIAFSDYFTRGNETLPAIVLSPLDELRQAAKQGGIFIPRRRVPLASQKPNIICFAVHETRLLVGLEKGQILIYDTSALFSSGTNDVTPLHVYQSQSSSPLRQISPNPGVEESLEEIIAVVHGDGVVHLLNGQLQSTDGWTGVDDTTPVGGASFPTYSWLKNSNPLISQCPGLLRANI